MRCGHEVKKAEIIAKVMKAARDSDDGRAAWTGPGITYLQYVSSDLNRKLKDLAPDVEMLTCEDFAHLGVKCCAVCHNEYPDELGLVKLKSDQLAWLCCFLERALDPPPGA
jgi:hypothetical protein